MKLSRTRRLWLPAVCGATVVAAMLPGAVASSASTVHKAASIGVSLTPADQAIFNANPSMNPSVVFGELKKQLAVPASWVSAAAAGPTVQVLMDATAQQAAPFITAFEQRYPMIKVNYTYGSATAARVTNPLLAFQAGKFTADVIAGTTSEIGQYREAHFYTNLESLPMWKYTPNGAKSTQGYYISFGEKFWGICYNTNKVTLSEMPKTWEDMLTDPVLRNGNLGILNRPNLSLEPLGGYYGLKWATNFEDKLFGEVKPQLSNAGLAAVPSFVAGGTFNVGFPCASYLTAPVQGSGAPVTWYSPAPLIANYSDIMVTADSQNPYGAKIFVNWMASEEGELQDWAAQDVTPMLKEMMVGNLSKFFGRYASQIANRPWTQIPPGQMEMWQSGYGATWNNLWNGASVG